MSPLPFSHKTSLKNYPILTPPPKKHSLTHHVLLNKYEDELEDAVYPIEFQNKEWYYRAGRIVNWENSPEYLRGDFMSLKSLDLDNHEVQFSSFHFCSNEL